MQLEKIREAAERVARSEGLEVVDVEWKIGKLRCVAVAPDGLRMAAGSDRGKVVIWDVDG